jgi:hypothetical protein
MLQAGLHAALHVQVVVMHGRPAAADAVRVVQTRHIHHRRQVRVILRRRAVQGAKLIFLGFEVFVAEARGWLAICLRFVGSAVPGEREKKSASRW